jgi:hypothetical protein
MTLTDLKRSLSQPQPPPVLSPALQALWWAAKQDWDAAHKLVMDETGKDSAWVHAYLHRAEGDNENARYWYQKAGKAPASGPSPPEWDAITAELLSI